MWRFRNINRSSIKQEGRQYCINLRRYGNMNSVRDWKSEWSRLKFNFLGNIKRERQSSWGSPFSKRYGRCSFNRLGNGTYKEVLSILCLQIISDGLRIKYKYLFESPQS